MKRSLASLLVASTLLTGGCATTGAAPGDGAPSQPRNVKEWMSQQSRAKRWALIGALTGAVLGAVTAGATGQNAWEGAAVGAVAGGIAGFLIGKGQDKIYAERDQAVRVAQYDPSQGYVAQIQEVKFDPAQPKPGQSANLYVRYLVVGPDPREDITVRMFRGLKYGEDYVVGAGPNDFTIPRGGGIVESTVAVTLPAKAPQGTYGVEALLEDPAGRFTQTVGSGSLYVVAARRPLTSQSQGS
jgi:outer membrane lipoprotein SlyB